MLCNNKVGEKWKNHTTLTIGKLYLYRKRTIRYDNNIKRK